MITTCTHCSARYRLDEEKVPRRVVRVRCPDCQGVFTLDGTVREAPVSDAPSDRISGFETGFGGGTGQEFVSPERAEAEPAAAPEPEVAEADSFAGVMNDPDPAPSAAQIEKPAKGSPGGRRRRRSKEEMLARALVSDILVYNRDLRDQALSEGNLVEAMGDEIKKSWELYKDKVTPEVANSTDCFREALNEILAEGEKVF